MKNSMKYVDIQQMGEGELKKSIAETRDALRTTRFSLSVGKMKENNRYGQLRRDLAKMLTEVRLRELQGKVQDLSTNDA